MKSMTIRSIRRFAVALIALAALAGCASIPGPIGAQRPRIASSSATEMFSPSTRILSAVRAAK
jgi:starvation-inducible outer membrane lipoprotein